MTSCMISRIALSTPLYADLAALSSRHARRHVRRSLAGIASQPAERSRLARLGRTSAVLGGLAGTAYLLDRQFNASSLERTARAGFQAVIIAADFKLNFRPGLEKDKLDALHQRVADRLHYVCTANAGLWIKFGQSIGVQAMVLPPAYRTAFANIFDAAPTVPWVEVEGVFMREFGKLPEELFDTFERKAIASASIAQVHKATLDGHIYAVKVQKPAIAKQMTFDLWGYRTLLRIFAFVFDMPIAFIGGYVSEQISREVDFVHEAQNSERTRELVAEEPSLAGKVFVPAVRWDRTTERVMTAEFVDKTCQLTSAAGLEKMGVSEKETMDIALNLTSAMIFKWGFMHSDIHPGNVLVRKHPDRPRHPQIVLIDHGLYVELPEKFRREYCTFWRSLFVADFASIEQVVRGWGFSNPELMASATLLRPYKMQKDNANGSKGGAPAKSAYETQVDLKAQLKSMFEAEEKIPRELVFLARTLRMAQSNNQVLGSPSNRIQLLAHWAAAGLDDAMAAQRRNRDFRAWLHDKWQLVVFKTVLLGIDVGFWLTKLRQVFLKVTTGKTEGFEDALQVADMAHDQFGIDL